MTATEEIVAQAAMLLMPATSWPGRPLTYVAPTKRDDWAGEEIKALSQPLAQSSAIIVTHRSVARRDEPWWNYSGRRCGNSGRSQTDHRVRYSKNILQGIQIDRKKPSAKDAGSVLK
jgi:hypothetical protein